MKILVTGGAGFVGSNLALRFKQDNPGAKITALDNLSRKGSALNIPRLIKAGIKFIRGDIRKSADLNSAGAFNLMLECSADPSVLAAYLKGPGHVIDNNLIGTVNCLEAVRKQKADIVFLSTSRVYPIKEICGLKYEELESRFELSSKQKLAGVSRKGISEEFPLGQARSLYGATKLASELLLQEYIDMFKIRGIINRCGVLAGPWQMGKVDQGVVALWVARHIFQGELSYIGFGGTGKQVRDILHVNDLYRLLCLQLKKIKQASGEVYNVGGGRAVSLSLFELTALCREITGRKIAIKPVNAQRQADIPYYISDYSKAREAFGWKPEISAKEIVQGVAGWINNNRDLLKPVFA